MDKDVILFFMCGLQEEWEKEIKSIRSDVEVRWLGQHVANVVSEEKPVVGIVNEIYEKIYEPIGDIYPCFEYCRSEVLRGGIFMKKTFKEGYTIKFDYQKPDGFWVIGCEENVYINVKHDVNEKCNHEKAEEIIRKKYPGCKIINVKYI